MSRGYASLCRFAFETLLCKKNSGVEKSQCECETECEFECGCDEIFFLHTPAHPHTVTNTP